MTFAVELEREAERLFLAQPGGWRSKASLIRALRDFAERGVGDVRKVPDGPGEYRIHVPPHVARFTVDVAARKIHVWLAWDPEAPPRHAPLLDDDTMPPMSEP